MANSNGNQTNLERSTPSIAPIIYKLVGHKPGESFASSRSAKFTKTELTDYSYVDTRLKVFSKEFHVHSIIFKLYSRYFRKFMDSADKVSADKTAKFQYDYASVVDVDEEETWGLEVVYKVSSRYPACRRSTETSADMPD
jgi:hypothetical protein